MRCCPVSVTSSVLLSDQFLEPFHIQRARHQFGADDVAGGRLPFDVQDFLFYICRRRITVYDVLEYLASGMTEQVIVQDFPDLTREDIRACLEFAADRERKLVSLPSQ